MFKYLSILIAVAGLAVGIYVIATSKEEIPSPPPAAPPSVNPFERGIMAVGLVESGGGGGRDVAIAAPEPSRVEAVRVQVGDLVKKGDVLYELDTRPLQADLVRARAAKASAQAEVKRLESQPRAEDIPPLRAAVSQAKVLLEWERDRYVRLTDAAERTAASPDEVRRQKFQVDSAQAAFDIAQTTLDRTLAGAWKEDLSVAASEVAAREAEMEALNIRVERLRVRSPIDGTVLKRNIEPGGFAGGLQGAEIPMIVGDLSTLRVRAQVDEEDAPILRAGARAVARVRGAVAAEVVLEMVRIEPFAQPKRQITNASTELIDTRVIEVVFEVKRGEGVGGVAIYPGQVVDVFIDAAEPGKK